MSDEKALLAAIWEHPHEDTPRLVYADWLQENGQPERAEFIRVQCELARLEEDDPKRIDFAKREENLWKAHGRTWRARLPSPLKIGRFHRGFPYPPQQSTTGKQYLNFPEVKLMAAPLWSFNLRQATRLQMARIDGSPVLRRTEKFMMWQVIPAFTLSALESLVASPNALNLETLGLTRQTLGDVGMQTFVRSANLPNLATLFLHGTGITDKGLQSLSDWHCAERLHELMLDENALGDASLTVIASGPLGRGLKSLMIGGNPAMTTAGLLHLIDSPAASSLASLSIANSPAVTPEFGEALAASPRAHALRQLILCGTSLGERGVAAILDSPHLQNLSHFYVRGCQIRAESKVAKRLDAQFGGGGYGPGAGGFRINRSK